MKWILISAIFVIALVGAEPPRRRLRPLFAVPQRLEAAPEAGQEAPYPPSGWKPSKPFYLPGEYGGPADEETPTEEATTEGASGPEETTPSATEDATTPAPNGDDADQQGEPTLNIPQDARNLQNAVGPVYIILPERNAMKAEYQLVPVGPYAGAYVLQEVTQQPYGYPTQSLVQILKK